MSVTVNPIRNDDDLDIALARLKAVWEPEPGTPESDELEVLMDLVESYERRTIPMGSEQKDLTLKSYLAMWGVKPKDLIPDLGSRGRVSEIINEKRSLTVPMILFLHEKFGMSYERLMEFAKVARKAR
jgi:HTH-type transcriptional regulator/antitoxin HigA